AFDFTDLSVAFQFLRNLDSLLQLRQRQLFDLPNNRWIQFNQRHLTLRLADLPPDLFLDLQKRLEGLMSGEQRLQNFVFRNHRGAALDHDDGVAASRQKNVHIAFQELALGRIDCPPAIDSTYPNSYERSIKRNIRNMEGR